MSAISVNQQVVHSTICETSLSNVLYKHSNGEQASPTNFKIDHTLSALS